MLPRIDIERVSARPAQFSLLEHMRVERGTADDWEALSALHYKAEGRPIGPHYWRCVLEHDGQRMLAGVAILSVAKLLLAPRHELFPAMKPGNDTKLTNVHRARVINANFRVNSRTVVDTLFRSVGVSYRLLNLAARMEGVKHVEIQSSMSKFNPFAMRAGFRFVKPRMPPAYEKGLALMKRHFRAHPSDQEAVLEELARLPVVVRGKALRELKDFYYKNSALEKTGGNLNKGTSKVDDMTPRELLKNFNQLVFTSPMYGCYDNPDAGRALPPSLPLAAFDLQKPHEPLRLDLL